MANKPALLDLSKYNQLSFVGGMNLLGDDTRLQPNQYRIGFNLTNRFDQLDEIFQSVEDLFAPNGIKQELTTFGNYQILFVSGFAFYKLYSDLNWKEIDNFQMSRTAPRFWTVAVPVSTTNYVRFAATGVLNTGTSNPAGTIQTANISGANFGNIPGLLVQDNINQPQFIFIGADGIPTARVTQNIKQWSISFTDATNTVVQNDINGIPMDNREYVPIGNSMTWDDGTLFITSQDTNFIYRSVSGRPLDFVVNVTNVLATNAAPVVLAYPTTTGIQELNGITIAPYTQVAGGDAQSTSYSVGVGGITCLRQQSSGGIFVAASNANFNVSKNKTPGAPTLFGEYTFIRTFLFNANCLSDRAIFDTTGDTRFIDLTGVRSFNAVEQEQNEGRNSVFTNSISAAFKGLIQDPNNVAGILYDNYELYAVQTIFGPAIAKYDTINNCWTSFEIMQTGGKLVKILAKIELAVQALFAVTQDDRVFQLYKGPILATATVRTVGVCSSVLYANTNLKMNNPENEIQLHKCRVVMNNIVAPLDPVTGLPNLTLPAGSISFTPYINNRVTKEGPIPKTIFYEEPAVISSNNTDLPDVNTQLCNICFATPNCEQGWKLFGIFTWTGGSITQFMMQMEDIEPENSMSSRGGKVV
jgi:hypothetical protein